VVADVSYFELRGAVRDVVVRRRADVDAEWVSERLVFDPAGRLTARSRAKLSSADRGGSQFSVAVGDDGRAVEEEVVGGTDAWETWRVPNVAFGCTGARLARTLTDQEGRPSRTTFSDADGRVLSWIDYATDSQGLVSVACAEGGRPAWETVSVFGSERTVYEWKYSDDGMMVTLTAVAQGHVTLTERCAYADFDARGNWRRSIIESGDSRREAYREIYYHPD
jgi:hypothetical protein